MLRRLALGRAPVGLQSLADEIAARENDKAIEELTDQERKRTYVSLYQTHVPAMVDAGVVDYDTDSGTIVPNASIAQLRQYLGAGPAAGPRSPTVYHGVPRGRDAQWWLVNAGLAVVGIVALSGLAMTISAVGPVMAVTTIALVALGAGTFSLLVVRWTREGSHTTVTRPPQVPGVRVPDETEWSEDHRPNHYDPSGTDERGRSGTLSPWTGRSEVGPVERDDR